MAERPVVIVSNRGPLSFRWTTTASWSPGGAPAGWCRGLAPLVAGTVATWIAAAISDGDRLAAARGVVEAEGFRVRLLALDPDAFRAAYDVVCNATLWFLHHGLYELARRPRFDTRFREAWEATGRSTRRSPTSWPSRRREVRPCSCRTTTSPWSACCLAERRPDLRPGPLQPHPVRQPRQLAGAPRSTSGRELLDGMAGHHACGFHSQRWADGVHGLLRGAARQPSPRRSSPRSPPTPPTSAGSPPGEACAAALAELDAAVGDRALWSRVDRIELSKNILRGFWAFEDLLERYPEWRERVVFGAFVYPSREGLPEYLAYRQEVETTVRRINERWADRRAGRRSCSTRPTTSPARSPRCAGPTCCSSTRSATG